MGMFEGLKRLFGGSSERPVASQREQVVTGAFEGSASLKPWEDQSVTPEERKEAYAALVQEKLAGIASAFDRAGEARDVAMQKEIMNSPETKKWMEEGAWLQSASVEEACQRLDRMEVIKLLGKNFLGAEVWKAQGIHVGEVPPLPKAITKQLIESDCPLHPGEKIKDTHLLVLMPRTVNGEAYTALKLDELCATWSGSGNDLIYERGEWATQWKSQTWASAPQAASEWVLIPKSDPDPHKVSADKHFRNKNIAEQHKVHDEHYQEYREAKTAELMTAVLLYHLTHKERLLPNYLRCVDSAVSRGHACVGYFGTDGLLVSVGSDLALDDIGRALVRKS